MDMEKRWEEERQQGEKKDQYKNYRMLLTSLFPINLHTPFRTYISISIVFFLLPCTSSASLSHMVFHNILFHTTIFSPLQYLVSLWPITQYSMFLGLPHFSMAAHVWDHNVSIFSVINHWSADGGHVHWVQAAFFLLVILFHLFA